MPGYDDRFSPPAPVAVVSLRQPDSGESVADISMLIEVSSGYARNVGWWRILDCLPFARKAA